MPVQRAEDLERVVAAAHEFHQLAAAAGNRGDDIDSRLDIVVVENRDETDFVYRVQNLQT